MPAVCGVSAGYGEITAVWQGSLVGRPDEVLESEHHRRRPRGQELVPPDQSRLSHRGWIGGETRAHRSLIAKCMMRVIWGAANCEILPAFTRE